MTQQLHLFDSPKGDLEYNSSQEIVFRIVNEFPFRQQIEFGELLGVSLGSNTSSFTHGLHRFPAKFIPQVPRWAIHQLREPWPVVLDPFMGSGTSVVEGMLCECTILGTEIDRLATLIAAAKTQKYDVARLRDIGAKICGRQGQKPGALILPMADVKNVEHWFSARAFSDLCLIFETIEMIPCTVEERNFFACVFSSIVRQVSNADDQTQKTYVSHTLRKEPPKVWHTFKKQLSRALQRVNEFALVRRGKGFVLQGSATTLPLEDKTVDLIITSPPYVDSVDYMYNLMLEYFWLGPSFGVHDRRQFNSLRRAPIGAKNPHSEKELPQSIRPFVDLSTIPDYRQKAISSYFALMEAHFSEAARVLKDEGRYVLVIGNSATIADTLRVHDCLIKLAGQFGLQLEHAFGYRIRRHYMKFPRKGRGGIILMDWVITLQKTMRARRFSRLPLPQLRMGVDEVAH